MSVERARRPLWRRLIGFNILTGIVLGVAGFYIGWWIQREQARLSDATRSLPPYNHEYLPPPERRAG